jgi:hypothetical protein
VKAARSLRIAIWAVAAALLLGAASNASAQRVYDLEHYRQYVSNGSWWRHATATNTTRSVITWRVSYSYQRCSNWSGAVSLVRLADAKLGYNTCQTHSGSMSQPLAPSTSAALLRRDVAHLNYYRVRTYDRLSGRLLGTAYATERDTFQEFTFSGLF